MAMAFACLDEAQRNLGADVDRALVALHGCHAVADSSVCLCLGERVPAHPAGSNYLSVSVLKRPGAYGYAVVTRSQPITGSRQATSALPGGWCSNAAKYASGIAAVAVKRHTVSGCPPPRAS